MKGKNLLRELMQHRLVRAVLLLLSGTTLAQGIPFLAQFVLARLYTEVQFGDLGIFMSVIWIVGAIIPLRYDLSIMLAKSKKESMALLILACGIVLLLSFLIFCISMVFAESLSSRLGFEDSRVFFYVPFAILGIALCQIFDHWFNLLGVYRTMITIKVGQAVVNSGLKIVFGLCGISLGLILGTFVGTIFMLLFTIFCFFQTFKCADYKDLSLKTILTTGKAFRNYSFFSTMSGLVNSVAVLGLPLIVAYFYGAEKAGIYFFGATFIRGMVGLLTHSMSQVFKKEAQELYHRKFFSELKTLAVRSMLIVGVILFLPVLILSVFGGEVFSLFFSERWEVSGQLVKYFAFIFLVSAPYVVIGFLFDIYRKQAMELFFNSLLLIVQIAMFAFLSQTLDFAMVLLCSSAGVVVIYFAMTRYCLCLISKSQKALQ